jgi:hypothetical protein
MADRLERFINLIAKTGDKLLVYDRHNPDDSFVVVGLTQYEQLIAKVSNVRDLTEDELIDKINSDITVWKSSQLSEPPRETVSTVSNEYAPEANSMKSNQFVKKPKTNPWIIPESRRREADEVIEEGRQYIEENPF